MGCNHTYMYVSEVTGSLASLVAVLKVASLLPIDLSRVLSPKKASLPVEEYELLPQTKLHTNSTCGEPYHAPFFVKFCTRSFLPGVQRDFEVCLRHGGSCQS